MPARPEPEPAWLGLDLGGTNTKLGLLGPTGLILVEETPSLVHQGPADWVARMAARARELMDRAAGQGLRVAGVGLGSPGALDREAGRVLFSPNLPSFNGFALGEELSRALGLPVALENDANLHALGEFHFGAGGGTRDLACLTLGTGVGGGLILGGRLVVGALGIGGELGHALVVSGGRDCPCGARGCLEAYASATALSGMLDEALAAGRDSLLPPGSPVEDMARAAAQGDALARELFASAGLALGRMAADLAVICGLDLVVVGGGVAQAWQWMEPAARRELAARLRMTDPARVEMAPSSLGSQAPLLGAGSLARIVHDGGAG